jgi:hypothetical protein
MRLLSHASGQTTYVTVFFFFFQGKKKSEADEKQSPASLYARHDISRVLCPVAGSSSLIGAQAPELNRQPTFIRCVK